jgi:hypothetical protein
VVVRHVGVVAECVLLRVAVEPKEISSQETCSRQGVGLARSKGRVSDRTDSHWWSKRDDTLKAVGSREILDRCGRIH